MNHDVDAGTGDVEEVARFDQFQALVHQGRRIDTDLRAHVPGWMCGRLGRRRRLQGGGIAVEERTARSGQHEAADLLRASRPQRLVDRGVFAVDRQDGRARGGRETPQHGPGRDHRLLVGERQVGAGRKRRRRRLKTGRADDCRHDEIDVAGPDRVQQCLVAARQADSVRQFAPQRGGPVGACNDHAVGPELARQLGQAGRSGSLGREHRNPQSVRVVARHRQGRLADRTGGPQDGDGALAQGRAPTVPVP